MNLVAYHSALIAALRNSDDLDGGLKISAVRTILDSFYDRVGLIYSHVIAKHRVYIWNGILSKTKSACPASTVTNAPQLPLCSQWPCFSRARRRKHGFT